MVKCLRTPFLVLTEHLLMIWFCYFCQKKLFWVYSSSSPCWPLLHKLGDPKNSNFLRFYNFFRTTRLQHKLLILIEFPTIFYWKSAEKSGCSLSGTICNKMGPMLWKKTKNLPLSKGFFIFCIRSTFKSKN